MLLTNKTSIVLYTGLILALLCLPESSSAQSMDDEIAYLISKVGRDGCSFVRNEQRYGGRDARRHLRSKLRRNEHLVNNTEEFITKLASASATTGRPYVIHCRGQGEQNAFDWFSTLLADFRQNESG